MRLLLVSFISSSTSTGMGKWSYRVAQALKDEGHDVELLFSNDFPRLRKCGRLAVLLFPLYLAFALARQPSSTFDVVILHERSCSLGSRALVLARTQTASGVMYVAAQRGEPALF